MNKTFNTSRPYHVCFLASLIYDTLSDSFVPSSKHKLEMVASTSTTRVSPRKDQTSQLTSDVVSIPCKGLLYAAGA